MEKVEIVCSENMGRIDAFVASQIPNLTRNAATVLIEDGNVLVNDKNIKKNYKLVAGDKVSITIPDPTPLEINAENIPLDVVYEDDDLLVVNKPKDMVVHPAPGNYEHTLVNALLYHCKDSLSGINGVLRPGIVHRIDKDTSGLLMVAKNDLSHNSLALQIKDHSFTREYEAIVCGKLKEDSGTVEAPIGRHPIKRKQMAVTDKNSKEAKTDYVVLGRYKGYTHVRLKLHTGRTHQIRVHMAYLGHPVVGDEVYGGIKVKEFKGQCLHAKKLGFIHPKTKEYMEFDSSLPEYFTKFLNKLEGY